MNDKYESAIKILEHWECEANIAALIALNNKGEWDAIEGYQRLLPYFESLHDEDSVEKIKEIISDELNHTEILREIMKKYDGNIPTAED